ncbi:MAG: hypothetical protein IT453_07180 [Planctomycetes bacterium]|nr:hypothetical protein [Planctomycetota bacterium]
MNARWLTRAAGVLLAIVALSALAVARQATAAPVRLADTGLYTDGRTESLASGVLAYSPQYPLWTDGATKRRWILLPPGASIDATDPDRWVFPVGTKLWKEFSFARRVETRYMELRSDGEWTFATYAWSVDGKEATLAPTRGAKGAYTLADGTRYDLPSQSDCRACHEAHPTRVLGFGALQLSPDRDPLAPHATPRTSREVELRELVDRGLVRNLPTEHYADAPRIDARTARERAALGYLHANCASCHNADGPLASLGMRLEQTLGVPRDANAALETTLDVIGRWRASDGAGCRRVAPGEPDASLLVRRIGSREPLMQMPPFGTRRADEQALELIAAWVREDLAPASRAAEASHRNNPPQVTTKDR